MRCLQTKLNPVKRFATFGDNNFRVYTNFYDGIIVFQLLGIKHRHSRGFSLSEIPPKCSNLKVIYSISVST